MSGFTSEDFAQVNLATKGEHGVARRTDPRGPHQWHVCGAGYGWFTDEEMATWGWEPVVESRITEHTLGRVEERAERKRRKLIDHIEFVEAALRDRNARVATLLDTKKAHERTICELRHDLAVARKGREPWADLADALRGTVWERLSGDVDGLAAAVHAAGWRKGGDDDE